MTDDAAKFPSPEARLIHAGTRRDLGAPATPPLVMASIHASWGEPDPARAYGRTGNPSWEALEEALGGLEDAEAVVFSSGQAATMALLLALAEGRRKILLPSDGYYNIRVLADWLRPHGAEPVFVDQLDLGQVERELAQGPAVLWAETPTNPLLRVSDLTALAGLAAAAGAPLAVDNTVATGLLQRPLDLGAVATMCSLTKSASGHADVLLGAVTTRDPDLLAKVRGWRGVGGGIPGPFESWLVLRGLRTLALRAERQADNALALARHLAAHPRVRAVHYPGTTTATLETARRQMPRGFGPLLSFEVDGTAADADAVVAASRLILPATSFGGVESAWERRGRWASETAPESLIRLSAGIEPVADLLTDLDRSLAASGSLRVGIRGRDVVAPGGGGPDHDPGGGLVELPTLGLFAPVMMPAQRGQSAFAGPAALVVGLRVVQVAAGGGWPRQSAGPAAGQSAPDGGRGRCQAAGPPDPARDRCECWRPGRSRSGPRRPHH